MDRTLNDQLEQRHWRFTYAALLLAIATPVALVLSRGVSPVLQVSITALLFGLAYAKKDQFDLIRGTRALVSSRSALLVCAVLAYCIASSVMSPDFPASTFTAFQFSLIAVMAALSIFITARHAIAIKWLGPVLILSLAVTSILVLAELNNGSPLRRLVGANGEAFRLNRAAVSIAVLVPLLLLFGRRAALRVPALISISLAVVVCFASASEAAKLAVVVALLVYVFCRFIPIRFSTPAIGLLTALSLIAAPLIAFALFNYVPQSFYDAVGYGYHATRPQIWWAFTELSINAPIFGHGFASAGLAPETYSGVGDDTLRLISMAHPHNFAVQVWYEMGLVGALLFTGLLGLAYRGLRALPETHQPVAFAMASSVWTVTLVSHGAWQPWWWSLLAITALLFVAAKKPS